MGVRPPDHALSLRGVAAPAAMNRSLAQVQQSHRRVNLAAVNRHHSSCADRHVLHSVAPNQQLNLAKLKELVAADCMTSAYQGAGG